jgi:hypothetical protein
MNDKKEEKKLNNKADKQDTTTKDCADLSTPRKYVSGKAFSFAEILADACRIFTDRKR